MTGWGNSNKVEYWTILFVLLNYSWKIPIWKQFREKYCKQIVKPSQNKPNHEYHHEYHHGYHHGCHNGYHHGYHHGNHCGYHHGYHHG